jgi:schlafen family protein
MNTRDLYLTWTLEDIEAFVSEGQEEHLYLDFKVANDPSLSRDDRRNLAKALSGFANSDGGIIVWGIDCRKDDQGRDVASELKPIPRIATFLTHLNSLTPQLVSPSVKGVQHRVLYDADGRGFAVSFIPSSDSAPHMAKGGEDRYYKRSGSSFLRMEHFEVADMFGSRQRPLLDIYYRIGQIVRLQDFRFRVIIGIRNSGRGSARDPFLALRLPTSLSIAEWGLDGNGRQGLRNLGAAYGSSYTGFSGSGEVSVHPGMDHDVTALEGFVRNGIPLDGEFRIDYRLAAEGFPLIEGTISILGEEISRAVREKTG